MCGDVLGRAVECEALRPVRRSPGHSAGADWKEEKGEGGGRKWGGLEVGFEESSNGVFDVVAVRSGEPRKADVNGDVVVGGGCRARSASTFEVKGVAVCL